MKKRKVAVSLIVGTLIASPAFADKKLEDTVVTAKTQSNVIDTGANITVITAEDIKKMNAESVDDAVKDVTGINLGINDSSISGRQNISIRGTDSKHVLILIDGKKVSGSDAQIGHSDFQYNWLPMSAIERIEVIKGPMSSLYGSQAIGGVINIITKKSKENFLGDIDVKVGTGDDGEQYNIAANVGGRIADRLSLSLFLEKQDKDPAEKIEDGSRVTKLEGKDVLNGYLKASFDIDDTQQVYAAFGMGEEDRLKIDDELYYDLERNNYSLGYSKKFKNIGFDVDYYVTDSDSHINTFRNNYTHNLTDSVFRTEARITALRNNFIVTGLEYKKEEYIKVYDSASVNARAGFSGENDNYSFFIQDEITLGKSFILTLAGRYDDHEKFGGEFTPRASLVYLLGENQRIKASYGQGFNAPTVTQNSSKYQVFMGPRHYFSGNDDLQPETSDTYELGYELYGDQFLFKAAVFKTSVESLITSRRLPGDSHRTYVNVDDVEMQGLELEASYDFTSDTYLKAGYSYLDSEDKSTGDELDFRPKHRANVRFSTMLPFGIESTIRANFTGKQKDDGGTTDIDSFITVDVHFSKDITDNFNIRLGVDNIFDEEIENGEPYDIRGLFGYIGLNYRF